MLDPGDLPDENAGLRRKPEIPVHPGGKGCLREGVSRTRAQAHSPIPRFMPKQALGSVLSRPLPWRHVVGGAPGGHAEKCKTIGWGQAFPARLCLAALLGDSPPDEVATQTLRGIGGVGRSAPATLRRSGEFPPPEVLAGAGWVGCPSVMSLRT